MEVLSTAVRSAPPDERTNCAHQFFYLVEVAPHTRICGFRNPSTRKVEPMELPLPWTYYLISSADYHSNPGWYDSYLARVGCRPTRLDLSCTDHSELYTLPLPNVGSGGYFCSPHARTLEGVEPSVAPGIMIERFWAETFSYNEGAGRSHAELYRWARLKTPPEGFDRYSLRPYRKWSKLTPEQVCAQPWVALDPGRFDPRNWTGLILYLGRTFVGSMSDWREELKRDPRVAHMAYHQGAVYP